MVERLAMLLSEGSSNSLYCRRCTYIALSFRQTLCFDAAANVEALPQALCFHFAFTPHYAPTLREYCQLHNRASCNWPTIYFVDI